MLIVGATGWIWRRHGGHQLVPNLSELLMVEASVARDASITIGGNRWGCETKEKLLGGRKNQHWRVLVDHGCMDWITWMDGFNLDALLDKMDGYMN